LAVFALWSGSAFAVNQMEQFLGTKVFCIECTIWDIDYDGIVRSTESVSFTLDRSAGRIRKT
jgi:hypothetical protein